MHIRNYLATLAYVNRQRAALGLAPLERLPAGRRGDPNDCAIARALPGATVRDTLDLPGRARRKLPARVRSFVHSFDREEQGPRGVFAIGERDPADIVEGGIDDEKGDLVPV
jgi:hypothetical protein